MLSPLGGASPANPDLWYYASLGWQPVVQKNTIVRRAEFRLDEIVDERGEFSIRHTAHFVCSVLRFCPLTIAIKYAS